MRDRAAERPFFGRIAAGVGALIALLLLAVAALSRPQPVPVSTARAARGDLLLPILADGTLEPPEGGEIRAAVNATVAELPATEGRRVRRGDVLLRLENASLSTRARDAAAAVEDLRADRVKVQADLEAARAEDARDRKTSESSERLLAEGAVTRSAAEADRAAAAAAAAKLRAAEARLASIGPRLALAEASARELNLRAEGLIVRAPADGVAYNLPRRVGESVGEGQLVANVADPDHLRVRIRVDQPDLPRINRGQRLVVTFDGLPERQWTGRVIQVSPGLREEGGRQVGEVLGEIADPTAQLPPNASVNVQIVVAEKKNALVVPRAALARDGTRRVVWVLADGRARRREVSIGLVAPNEVEITSGLAAGERVLLPAAVPLTEGLRVAAK